VDVWTAIVPAGATGVLVPDLDCSLSYGSYAVVLSSATPA
jgi:hypothetical protein